MDHLTQTNIKRGCDRIIDSGLQAAAFAHTLESVTQFHHRKIDFRVNFTRLTLRVSFTASAFLLAAFAPSADLGHLQLTGTCVSPGEVVEADTEGSI